MVQYPQMPGSGAGQPTAARAEVVNIFMRGVYGWMSLGLGLTAVVAFFASTSPAVLNVLFNVNPANGAATISPLVWGLFIGEFILVMALAGAIHKMSATTASTLFLVYAGVNGLTLTPIVLLYTAQSIAATFAVTAGMFGAMSIYGLVTKKDLTSWGSFLFMGLIGIVIASVVNIFMHSSALHFAISIIGVFIFLGLTAYDTQKLRKMGESAPLHDGTAIRRGTILGALSLYLDFLNLFLMLLRFMGDRR